MTANSDRIVVITGASSGIGAALAELLASRGMSVVLAARRKQALEEVASRCGGRASVYAAAVSVRAEVRALVDDTITRLGRFYVWINNGGVGITRSSSELPDED